MSNVFDGGHLAPVFQLLGQVFRPERTPAEKRAFTDELWDETEQRVLRTHIESMVPGSHVHLKPAGATRTCHAVLASYLVKDDLTQSTLELARWTPAGEREEIVVSVMDVDDVVPSHIDPSTLYRRVDGATQRIDPLYAPHPERL